MNLKFFPILIILIFSFKAHSQYTLNDIPYSLDEINQKNKFDKKEGVWYYYNQFGVINSLRNYKNDTLNGYFENYWFTNGIVSEKGFYKNGLLDSIMTAYWENGLERAKLNYKNGLLNGITITHDKNGNLTSKIRYINDKRDSTYTEMYIDPNIEWDNDRPIKKDTIYTQEMKGKYEKYAIYRDNKLVQAYNIKDRIKLNETFYTSPENYKRIIYCTKKPYGIRKIFYFENHTLIKTELVNDKCKKK